LFQKNITAASEQFYAGSKPDCGFGRKESGDNTAVAEKSRAAGKPDPAINTTGGARGKLVATRNSDNSADEK